MVVFFYSGLNCMDATIVALGVAGEIFGNMGSVSVLRTIRLVKLARIVRLLAAFRELYLIVFGMLGAMKAIFWAGVMTCLMLTVCSIFAVEFIHPIAMNLEW